MAVFPLMPYRIFLSPGAIPSDKQQEASMTVLRQRIGEPLNYDDTTPLHHALMVEERPDGEHPHPQ